MLLRKWWVAVIVVVAIVTVLVVIEYLELFVVRDYFIPTEVCTWREGDPQLFYLKTTSGVNYDGGHWFHVAENFMVQHAILRSNGGAADASDVYFNTDRGLNIIPLQQHHQK
jgi:hypothetical protein